MGALSIAFDIIIVGALALPWVLLVIHFFFSTNVSRVSSLVRLVNKQNQPAVAGVLLFAMTYSLGSAVSRIAQDFLDDDDLHVHAFHYLFRVGVTESSIRTNVFCNAFKDTETSTPGEPASGKPEPSKTSTPERTDPTAAKHEKFKKNNQDCTYTGRWIIQTYDPVAHQRLIGDANTDPADWINGQEVLAGDIFRYQEAAVLLLGTDPTERVRQFHDQIMVLRGAAFNGLIAFSLCLFWWSAQSHPGVGWAASLFYALLGLNASYHHFSVTPLIDPPYMEFTWLALAAAGCYILSGHPPKGKRGHEKRGVPSGRKPIPFGYLLLAAFLTTAASLGWWATQVLYDQQVIYSFQAMSESANKPATHAP
jgi:hypothetical protein